MKITINKRLILLLMIATSSAPINTMLRQTILKLSQSQIPSIALSQSPSTETFSVLERKQLCITKPPLYTHSKIQRLISKPSEDDTEQSDHEYSHSKQRSWWQRWRRLCAIGALTTVGAIASTARLYTYAADKTKNPYDHDFLRKAGFKQGLPYWYAGQFATQLDNVAIGNNLKLKIEFSLYAHTYRPSYLKPHECAPVWNSVGWQHENGYIKARSMNPGIKIHLMDAAQETVASCLLSPAGSLNCVHVTYDKRGKGYGSLLLSVAKQISLEMGIDELSLHVYPYDRRDACSIDEFDATVRFYQKNGFVGNRMFNVESAKKDLRPFSHYNRMICTIKKSAKKQPIDEEDFFTLLVDHSWMN